MSRQGVLQQLSVMKKLDKLRQLPTLKQVYQGYMWRHNELQAGHGPNYRPPRQEVATLVAEDILITWEYASLIDNVVSKTRIIKKVKEMAEMVYKLKSAPRHGPSHQRKIDDLSNKADQLFEIAYCKCDISEWAAGSADDIPCVNRWRSKVVCRCPMQYRLHPREVEFLHDQRNNRLMRIGSFDRDVTSLNVQRIENRHHAVQEQSQAEPEVNNNALPEIESDFSEGYDSSDSDFEADDFMEHCGELISDNVCRLTDRRHISLRSTAEILNDAATNLGHSSECRSHMTVFRRKTERRTKALEDNVLAIENEFKQLLIDGKQVFGRERFAGLLISALHKVFGCFKTYRASESCNAEACTDMIINFIPNASSLLSILADTTALNTGILGGIFRRLEIIFKRAFETDIITLECLFHIIELLLGKVIRCYDGETVSPTGLEEGAVQNRIETICPSSLTETNLKSHETIDITPTQMYRIF